MAEPEPFRSLEKALAESIGPLKNQRKFLLQLLLAILAQRSISLPWLAQALNTGADPHSNRKRIQRFFDNRNVRCVHFAQLIAPFLPQTPWILAIDRTNWYWGKAAINFLVLAVVFRGSAIPLFWMVLNRDGNSHSTQRITLMEEFLRTFGVGQIHYITGDREFIGGDWLEFLQKRRIPFRFRIRRDDLVVDEQGGQWEVQRLFCRTNRCKKSSYRLWGVPVYLGGKPLSGGQFLIIVSNEPGDLLLDYRRRWKIECLFQSLKGRGFDLESTRIVDGGRLSSLLGVLALVHVLCLRVGEAVKEQVCKSTGRLRKSVARRGLEVLHGFAWRILALQQRLTGENRTGLIPGKT